MNREDILRELELLPIWQLRDPAPVQTEAVSTQVHAEPKVSEMLTSDVKVERKNNFRTILSDDTQWAFVLPQEQSEAAEALLANMLKAVSVKVGQDNKSVNTEILSQYAMKLIVVMGELEAQTLLEMQQTLEELRGDIHQHDGTAVVVTYTPEHLLSNLQDKAKAWEDLCLAKFTIADL